MNPLLEDVSLQAQAFFTTIPAGSFTQERKEAVTFTGVINQVALSERPIRRKRNEKL
jgi:hypothetical protein